MITEDDDDTHICLKCHTTIHGLENYVNHRKSGCNNQPTVDAKPRTLSPLIPASDEPDFSLKADDFFSLLELQSSTKKTSLTVPAASKTINSGVLTRSKATAVIQANNPNRASDWIGGHQLRELGNEDNQTKLINAVDNISGHIKKEEIRPPRPTDVYEDDLEDESADDYEDDDEEFDDDNGPPRTHTGGKWKPSISPYQWLRPSSSHCPDYRNDWEPPPSHTGGKWKPTLPQNPQFDTDDVEDKNIPPPGHTKGKWIPGRNDDGSGHQKQDDYPPFRKSSGTVQYWCGPCNRHLASKLVYDRHLKSELHYKRTLHEREFENTSDYYHHQKHNRAEGKRKIKKPQHEWLNVKKTELLMKTKRTRKHPSTRCDVCKLTVYNHQMGKHLISHYHCQKRNISKTIAQQMVLDNIHGIVLQSPFQCGTCRFYCNDESTFLTHWRSNDHKISADKTKGFFSCGFCKFQTQHNDVLMEHLLSDNHREVVAVINRSVPIVIKKIVPIKCVSCTKQFRYNAELRKHCKNKNHIMNNSSTDKYQDRHQCPDCSISMKSNKSLQRHLLRKHNKHHFFCSTCSMIFDTELESKLHRQTQEHKNAVLTKHNTMNATSSNKTCQHCYIKFESLMHLKRHLMKEHPDRYFSCSKCGQQFTLSQEVSGHIKANLCTFEATPNIAYFNCGKCPFKTNSEGDYLFHVALHTEPLSIYDLDQQTSSKKPAICQYKCPICEKYFRKSSLRCHVRQHTNERPFKCQSCTAAYTRKSNLVDHIKRRHSEYPEDPDDPEDSEDRQISGLRTDLFPVDFLSIQHKEFTNNRGEQSQNHVRLVNNAETEEDKIKTQQERPKETRDKKFLCAFCGKSFMKKFTLLQHIKTHTGKEWLCPLENCVYKGRTTTELKIHLSTHSPIKSFKCDHCEHRTKTKAQLARHLKVHNANETKKYKCTFCMFASRTRSHLKRHLRLHTGAKPFQCPHCLYSCNNLENLRKHILSTNKHPGKCIYECSFCEEPDEFGTNFAKDFRVHLMTCHSNRFDTIKEAASYIVGIYNAEEDSQMKTNLISNQQNEKSETTDLLTSTIDDNHPNNSELLSMVVVANPREDVIYVEVPSTGTENWTMEGYYDVEESGTLVPFHSDNSNLLNEDFDSENQ